MICELPPKEALEAASRTWYERLGDVALSGVAQAGDAATAAALNLMWPWGAILFAALIVIAMFRGRGASSANIIIRRE